MKLLKSILSISLIIFLIFSSIACEKKSDPDVNQKTETTIDKEKDSDPENTQSTLKLTENAKEQSDSDKSKTDLTDSDNKTATTQKIANDFNYDEEPDSPVAEIKISQAEQGVSGREAERFFKTFSTIPVYYDYKSTVLPENKTQHVTISIDESGRIYTKIESDTDSVEIVSNVEQKYFELDRENKVANEISQEVAQGEIISKHVFEQIYSQAELLYFVGTSKGNFNESEVDFEEYTKDNKTFVRYYFDEESVFGHRTFENNQLKSQVEIYALKNYFPEQMDIFTIPEDFTLNTISPDK